MSKYIVLILLVVLIAGIIWSKDVVDYLCQRRAIEAMQQECARNCAWHGVNQNSLVGPTLVFLFDGSRAETMKRSYLWHSINHRVTLKVDYIQNPGEAGDFVFTWGN